MKPMPMNITGFFDEKGVTGYSDAAIYELIEGKIRFRLMVQVGHVTPMISHILRAAYESVRGSGV